MVAVYSVDSRLVRRMIAGLLLFAASQAQAAPPWGFDRPEVRDVELTLHARRAVQKAPDLARHNLGVSVRHGEATVWGSVPTRETADRALAVVGNVRGIYKVRSDLLVAGGHDDVLDSLLAGLASGLKPDDPFPWYQPSARQTGQTADDGPREVISAQPPRSAWSTPPAPPHPSVTLLPPVAAPDESSAEDLASAVERLRAADRRFGDVRAEICQGTVVLSGRVEYAMDLIELGGVISRIPGVRSVDLRGVETAR